MKYLIDSSVILTLLISPDRGRARKLAKHIENLNGDLGCLEFTKIEVSNGLIYGLGSEDEIEKIYKSFLTYEFEFIQPSEITLKYARQIAIKVGDSVYDSLYHSYAILNSLTFITLDKKYYQKAHLLGNIVLLNV